MEVVRAQIIYTHSVKHSMSQSLVDVIWRNHLTYLRVNIYEARVKNWFQPLKLLEKKEPDLIEGHGTISNGHVNVWYSQVYDTIRCLNFLS